MQQAGEASPGKQRAIPAGMQDNARQSLKPRGARARPRTCFRIDNIPRTPCRETVPIYEISPYWERVPISTLPATPFRKARRRCTEPRPVPVSRASPQVGTIFAQYAGNRILETVMASANQIISGTTPGGLRCLRSCDLPSMPAAHLVTARVDRLRCARCEERPKKTIRSADIENPTNSGCPGVPGQIPGPSPERRTGRHETTQ